MRRINGFSVFLFDHSRTQIQLWIKSTVEYPHSFEIRLISVTFFSFSLAFFFFSFLSFQSLIQMEMMIQNLCDQQQKKKKWQHFRRELVNLSTLFVPWQLRIKEIESHFGSVVASYFTFLRWLFWVNIVLAFTLSTFVILPEVSNFLIPSHSILNKTMLMKSPELTIFHRSSFIFFSLMFVCDLIKTFLFIFPMKK